MRKIVYCSHTGHTKKYAELLAKELEIPCYSYKEMEGNVTKEDTILFMSWVMASTIVNYSKIKEKYTIDGIIAVGMSVANETNQEELKNINKIQVPFFYLKGGLDYTKLKGFKKLIIKMVGKQVIKLNKPEDKEMIEMFKHGGDFVKKEALQSIIEYYK